MKMSLFQLLTLLWLDMTNAESELINKSLLVTANNSQSTLKPVSPMNVSAGEGTAKAEPELITKSSLVTAKNSQSTLKPVSSINVSVREDTTNAEPEPITELLLVTVNNKSTLKVLLMNVSAGEDTTNAEPELITKSLLVTANNSQSTLKPVSSMNVSASEDTTKSEPELITKSLLVTANNSQSTLQPVSSMNVSAAMRCRLENNLGFVNLDALPNGSRMINKTYGNTSSSLTLVHLPPDREYPHILQIMRMVCLIGGSATQNKTTICYNTTTNNWDETFGNQSSFALDSLNTNIAVKNDKLYVCSFGRKIGYCIVYNLSDGNQIEGPYNYSAQSLTSLHVAVIDGQNRYLFIQTANEVYKSNSTNSTVQELLCSKCQLLNNCIPCLAPIVEPAGMVIMKNNTTGCNYSEWSAWRNVTIGEEKWKMRSREALGLNISDADCGCLHQLKELNVDSPNTDSSTENPGYSSCIDRNDSGKCKEKQGIKMHRLDNKESSCFSENDNQTDIIADPEVMEFCEPRCIYHLSELTVKVDKENNNMTDNTVVSLSITIPVESIGSVSASDCKSKVIKKKLEFKSNLEYQNISYMRPAIAFANDTIKFTCLVDREGKYKWWKGSAKLLDTEFRGTTAYGFELKLGKVNRGMEDTYSCRFNNRVISEVNFIILKALPSVHVEKLTTVGADDAMFICKLTNIAGILKPMIRWAIARDKYGKHILHNYDTPNSSCEQNQNMTGFNEFRYHANMTDNGNYLVCIVDWCKCQTCGIKTAERMTAQVASIKVENCAWSRWITVLPCHRPLNNPDSTCYRTKMKYPIDKGFGKRPTICKNPIIRNETCNIGNTTCDLNCILSDPDYGTCRLVDMPNKQPQCQRIVRRTIKVNGTGKGIKCLEQNLIQDTECSENQPMAEPCHAEVMRRNCMKAFIEENGKFCESICNNQGRLVPELEYNRHNAQCSNFSEFKFVNRSACSKRECAKDCHFKTNVLLEFLHDSPVKIWNETCGTVKRILHFTKIMNYFVEGTDMVSSACPTNHNYITTIPAQAIKCLESYESIRVGRSIGCSGVKWTDWSDCSVGCNVGSRTRHREVRYGRECETIEDMEPCMMMVCPEFIRDNFCVFLYYNTTDEEAEQMINGRQLIAGNATCKIHSNDINFNETRRPIPDVYTPEYTTSPYEDNNTCEPELQYIEVPIGTYILIIFIIVLIVLIMALVVRQVILRCRSPTNTKKSDYNLVRNNEQNHIGANGQMDLPPLKTLSEESLSNPSMLIMVNEKSVGDPSDVPKVAKDTAQTETVKTTDLDTSSISKDTKVNVKRTKCQKIEIVQSKFHMEVFDRAKFSNLLAIPTTDENPKEAEKVQEKQISEQIQTPLKEELVKMQTKSKEFQQDNLAQVVQVKENNIPAV